MKTTTTTAGQRYAVATRLSIDTLENTLRKIVGEELKEFAKQIDKHYKKRDGFIPREVLRILNSYLG